MPFVWGWYAELMRCFMPDNLNSSSTTALLNSVPEMKLYFNYYFLTNCITFVHMACKYFTNYTHLGHL